MRTYSLSEFVRGINELLGYDVRVHCTPDRTMLWGRGQGLQIPIHTLLEEAWSPEQFRRLCVLLSMMCQDPQEVLLND